MANIGKLTGTVKHYDWGGAVFIPALLDVSNTENKPFAEYWLGVHPQADCKIVFPDGNNTLFRDYINANAEGLLGTNVYKQFGSVPFLLKALDVNDMLSIQVHPSKAAAEKDFAAENAAGVPLDSPQRNYKDTNHKPELMVAMGDFWLLHGFRPPASMKEIIAGVPELEFLLPVFADNNYTAVYQLVMEMPAEEVNRRLEPLLARILPLYESGKISKSNPDYWAAKGHLTFSKPGKTDRGIFSVYLFNLVEVKQGQAVFQDAGVPHAYLFGQNIEIMASSDNVLRGGLTNKHIDVKELLKHTKCEPTYPDILKGEKTGPYTVYKTPAPEFELGSFNLKKGESASFNLVTTEVFLLVKGAVTVASGGSTVEVHIGEPSAVLFPGNDIVLTAIEDSLVFKATVPGA
ncbi:mannose-6-phosphate isomerase, class I [Terrimonas sp. NA20]|uniref:mannose-6-phosphate isomerase n=1 Tax=Terrimonas ginsenosidimutans TaxID=2908004 RepID=A0ABS9KYK6_9BACT|nr:mannose-6-phosphate isomerase, class I [Terrimonas ginsenosidimutans]MCG2617312.1 mannose-6-phosphate isomerase, class I [Terrimonas ginsenosidimutans]